METIQIALAESRNGYTVFIPHTPMPYSIQSVLSLGKHEPPDQPTNIRKGYSKLKGSVFPKNGKVLSAHFVYDLVKSPDFASGQNTVDFFVQRMLSLTETSANPGPGVNINTELGIVINPVTVFQYSSMPKEYRYDITSQIKGVIENNEAFEGLFYTASTRTALEQFIEIRPKYIEIIYESFITTPSVISPNGGESMSGVKQISWTTSTSDKIATNLIAYDIQFSANGGTTWQTIATTQAGITTYEYDFSTLTETSRGKIRIRGKQGVSVSDWDESNGVFSVVTNQAPFKPTIIAPKNTAVNRTVANILSWKHNGVNSYGRQSSVTINWRLQGATTWETTTINSALETHYVAPNTFPLGQIEWRVLTHNQNGSASPWSDLAVFGSADQTGASTILQPQENVTISRPIVEWAGGTQVSYQVIIEDTLSVVVWDTGEVVSGNKAITVGVDLENGATYKIRVRTKDGGGLFSSFSEKMITVNYTPPTKPGLTAWMGQYGVQLSVENPAPTGTQPLLKRNDLYKLVKGEWIRIAIDIHTSHLDLSTVSDEVASYRVRAVGVNETISDSDVVVVRAPKITGMYLHDVDDPAVSHHYKYVARESVSDSLQRAHAYRQFSGRNRPVIEFGLHSEYGVSLSIHLLRDQTGRQRLIEFANNNSIVLYRDSKGRKVYTAFPELNFQDLFYGNTIDLKIVEIYYNEEV